MADHLLGKKAPAFILPDQNGNMHTLSDYKGKYVLLYFYPKDDTPGCTTEACGFRDMTDTFTKRGVVVLGVSADSVRSHKKFADKFHLLFPLLSDTEKEVIMKYDVWKEKSMFGKKYMGIQRDSYLIDPKGIVIHHFEKVNPLSHPEEVLRIATAA